MGEVLLVLLVDFGREGFEGGENVEGNRNGELSGGSKGGGEGSAEELCRAVGIIFDD